MPRDATAQRQHFDSERNQYSLDALANPPRHTRLEEQRLVASLSDLPIAATIVDFGAGTGRISLAVARSGRCVTAVDISRDSLDKLQSVARQLVVDGITVATSIPSIPVDAIVGADILHHVPLAETMPELYAALAPGGRIVFSEPGGFHPFWYLYQTARRSMWIERRTATINRWWLPRRLKAAGFEHISMRGVGLLPRPLANVSQRLCEYNDDVAALPGVNWFAYRYLIEARKPLVQVHRAPSSVISGTATRSPS
jgi:2-polyprenyl-3-methyl-5-hydroxy-6-metoxy-1,4-benzoquinol methylase